MKRATIILLIFLYFFNSNAKNNLSVPIDDIQISILTCSPGEEIYTLFGHTAIRVQIPSRYIDDVYNYGLFNFNSYNFAFRFALGETDYQLGSEPFESFLYEYQYFKRDVWEQSLNLTYSQKLKVIEALNINILPENATYRYNFFYDNCATRPLQIITNCVESLQLPDSLYNYPLSYRDIIDKYSKQSLWSRFGMNLCIGSSADTPINIQQLTFAPLELMQILELTSIDKIKATSGVDEILQFDKNSDATPFLYSPIFIFSILLFAVVGISVWEIKKKQSLYLINGVLFSIYGVVGCVLLFLVLFSEHPTVSPNYLLILFHPIHLIWAPILIFREYKEKKIYYHYINLCVLTLFILFYWAIPQRFEFAILPLASCLLIRSLTYILINRRK